MLLSTHDGSAPTIEIAPGFRLQLDFGTRGGDFGDGEPVFEAPPVTMSAATSSSVVRHRVTNLAPVSVGRRLRQELEAEFPLGCQCHNCLRGRHALQLV